MEIRIPLYLTKDKMPEPHVIVIVAGGVALWTGSVWLSACVISGNDPYRVIDWPVKWWVPIRELTDEADSMTATPTKVT